MYGNSLAIFLQVQSSLVISKSKGPSATLRDIRTSTYQMCRIEENTNQTTKFHKWTCNLTPLVRNICWKYCGKGEKLLLRSNFSSYPQYLLPDVRIDVRQGSDFLFEITEVEITRVDCTVNCLVISKLKGPSEILRDIRTSTYQMCRTEEKYNSNNQISHMNM